MKKMTLLEMTQNILSALDSDEVNSISDTVESAQVAEIIKETFYEQFNNIYIPEFQTLFQLESVNDPSRPNYMKLPENISKINWLKYRDYRTDGLMQEIQYVAPDEFFNTQLAYNGDLQVTDATGLAYFVHNTHGPTQFTMLDDDYIIFNGFDSEHEVATQAINSLGYGTKTNAFLLDDSYVPPIDGNLFPLLLAESKSVAFVNLKQVSSTKEEQRARRQRIRMQNDQFRSRTAQYTYWNRGPDYSRSR